MIAIRSTPDPNLLAQWALVLDAERIPYRTVQAEGAHHLVVEAENAEAARFVLDAFERENAPPPPPPPAPAEYGWTGAAVLAAVAILSFHAAQGEAHEHWIRLGRATAARIRDGELWRLVTALTLHSGAVHVFGNAVFLSVLGTAVCRALGPGIGLGLILLSGTAGNAINAAVRGTGHSAIGASTAVFGALGILVGRQLHQRMRHEHLSRGRTWAPLAAGLALLGFTGGSAETDVLAHAFGFFAGIGIGFAMARLVERPAPPRLQAVALAVTVFIVLLSWSYALAGGR